MNNVLVYQEETHVATVASFAYNFSAIGFQIDICAPNKFKMLDDFRDSGIDFCSIKDKEAEERVLSYSYDLIVFNTAEHIFMKNKMPGTQKIVNAIKESGFSSSRAIAFHHRLAARFLDHPFVKISCPPFYREDMEHYLVPYYPLFDCKPERDAPLAFSLFGGAANAAWEQRSSLMLTAFAEYLDQCNSEHRIFWFSGSFGPSLRALEDRFRSLTLVKGASYRDIQQRLKAFRPYAATFFERDSIYHRDVLSGSIPLSVNMGLPLVTDPKTIESYGLAGGAIEEPAQPSRIPALVSKLDSDYSELPWERARNMRSQKLKENQETLLRLIPPTR